MRGKEKMNRKIGVLLLLIGLLFCSRFILAEEEEGERIILHSHYMRYLREEGFYLAREEVRIYYKEYILTGDEAEIHEADEVLYLTGNVVIYQEDDVLQGDFFTFYYDRDYMIMDSPFDLLQYRETEKEDGTIEKEPLHMVGEYLEIFGEEDRIYARQDVHMSFREFRTWSQELDYYEQIDELHLKGDVLIEENGEFIRAQEAKIWLEEDIFEAWGDVEADVQIRKKEKNGEERLEMEEEEQEEEQEEEEQD